MMWRGWFFILTGPLLYIATCALTTVTGSFYAYLLYMFIPAQGLRGILDLRVISMTGWLSIPIIFISLYGTDRLILLSGILYSSLLFLYFWPKARPLFTKMMAMFYGELTNENLPTLLTKELKKFVAKHGTTRPASLTLTLYPALTAHFAFYKNMNNIDLKGTQSLTGETDTTSRELYTASCRHYMHKQLAKTPWRWAISSNDALTISYTESTHRAMERISALETTSPYHIKQKR